MQTNLIFKRQVTNDGVTKVVTRIVKVDIPVIDSGDGWILSGHTDCLEVSEGVYVHPVAPAITCTDTKKEVTSDTSCNTTIDSTKFESDVKGTAKLVRSKGVIKIVARRGKTTYNQTTANSVCINDFTKNEFFKNCRELHGNSGEFEIKPSDGNAYHYWNNIIDKEYIRQKNVYYHK